MMRTLTGSMLGLVVFFVTSQMAFADFTYQPPGDLVSGSGTGRVDETVYVPGMRFPIEEAPAFANSQVWGHGGMNGPGGGQCDSNNYSYPWWDNYCESRSWAMPLCPSGQGHQGQDIRPATCTDMAHWAVAAEAGTITSIGTYSVNLVTSDGTQHRYLHMDPGSLAVSTGDEVQRGQRLGRVSNAFGGTPTTIHLHYDIRQNVSGVGQVYVPTYMSLVRSYQELIGQPEEPCGVLGADGGIIDNGDSCFRLLGNLGTWRTEQAGYGGSLHWTYAWDAAQADGYARWSLHFAEAGVYEVEVYVEAEFADSTQARYVVRAGGVDEEIRLDQSAGGGWRYLGEFDFAGDDEEWVEIYDNTGEPLSENIRFVADAIRISPVVEEPEPGSDVGGGQGEDAGDQGIDDVGVGGDVEGQERPDLQAGMVSTRSCAQSPAAPSTMFLLTLIVFMAVQFRRK